MGEREHQVALFRFKASTFALIPGGPATLGYDADRPWEPSADELENWLDARRMGWFDEGRTIRECLSDVTLRPRRVELGAYLIETVAEEFGREAIGLDDPVVQQLIPRAGFVARLSETQVTTQVTRNLDGSFLAERFSDGKWTHADLAARLAADGFRFPTSDEWEYACGAGAPTLFRWGDHAPCDWPDLPGGGYGDSPGGFPYDWNAYEEPNAFGLVIASSSYKNELVAEAGLSRGGDGGDAACGGAPAFIKWLPHATAYFEARHCKYDPSKPILVGYTIGRRVLTLA